MGPAEHLAVAVFEEEALAPPRHILAHGTNLPGNMCRPVDAPNPPGTIINPLAGILV